MWTESICLDMPFPRDFTAGLVYRWLIAHIWPNNCLCVRLQALQRRELSSDPRAEKQVVALLSIPLDTYDAVTVLGLRNYPSVMSLLSPPTYKQMSVTIVQSMLKAGTLVGSEAKVGMLFDFISPLVKDVPGALDHTDDEVSFTMLYLFVS